MEFRAWWRVNRGNVNAPDAGGGGGGRVRVRGNGTWREKGRGGVSG
jgi:hypothetical protein